MFGLRGEEAGSGLRRRGQEPREGVARVCANFPDAYWRERDRTETDPAEFHAALARGGWLCVALPEALGGSGLGIAEATVMMQTIAESGAGMAGGQAVHANIYATQPLARFGTPEQHARVVPAVLAGASCVCFGVTEPNAGLDTRRLTTTATRQADGSYRVTGAKVWITCAQVAAHMMLLARTSTPAAAAATAAASGSASDGLSLFCIDLDRSAPGLEMRRIRKMGGRAVDAHEVFFDGYAVPGDTLVGAEGGGFRAVLHGMNAERCLLASEALGLGFAALRRAADYARRRVVSAAPSPPSAAK